MKKARQKGISCRAIRDLIRKYFWVRLLQDLLRGELQRLFLVFPSLDVDRVLFVEVTSGFLPYVEFVCSDRQVLDFEVTILIGYCGVRVIEDNPVGHHPRVNIATDFGGKLFSEGERLDGNTDSVFWCDDEIILAILDRIGVRVVGRFVVRENENRLIGSDEQNVRCESASFLVEGDLWDRTLLNGRSNFCRLLGEVDNDVGNPLVCRIDDKLFVGNILSGTNCGIFRGSIAFYDQQINLWDIAVKQNLTF